MRSLARNAGYLSSHGSGESSNSPLMAEHFHDHDDGGHEDGEQEIGAEAEALQEQVAATVNNDPAALLPVSREDEAFEDLERGIDRRR